MRLDRIDFEILARLQNDARLSNKQLAAAVALAPSTCLERVRRLRNAGVLRGFHAEVAPKALGIGLQALVTVRIQRHAREMFVQFQDHLRGMREIVAFYHVAGANDFIIHVAVRDAEHLQRLILDAFTIREEVEHMETALIFAHERRAALPAYAETSRQDRIVDRRRR